MTGRRRLELLEGSAVAACALLAAPIVVRLAAQPALPPGRWPESYGIAGSPVPPDYARPLLYPFRTS